MNINEDKITRNTIHNVCEKKNKISNGEKKKKRKMLPINAPPPTPARLPVYHGAGILPISEGKRTITDDRRAAPSPSSSWTDCSWNL